MADYLLGMHKALRYKQAVYVNTQILMFIFTIISVQGSLSMLVTFLSLQQNHRCLKIDQRFISTHVFSGGFNVESQPPGQKQHGARTLLLSYWPGSKERQKGKMQG